MDVMDGLIHRKQTRKLLFTPTKLLASLQASLPPEEVCTGHFFPQIFIGACCFPLILNGCLFWVLPQSPWETSIKQTTVWVKMQP